MSDIQSVIRAMIASLGGTGRQFRPGVGTKPTVCFSREYGALGDQIARLTADRLGVKLFDVQIIDRIADRLNADPETVRALDHGLDRVRDLWMYRLFTGVDITPDSYRYNLVNVLLSCGRTGGVLIGRGSHMVLAGTGALRVRVVASLDMRATRVAARTGTSLEQARKAVQAEDAKRINFVAETFGTAGLEPHFFDLTINTDQLSDLDMIADMIVNSARALRRAEEQAQSLGH